MTGHHNRVGCRGDILLFPTASLFNLTLPHTYIFATQNKIGHDFQSRIEDYLTANNIPYKANPFNGTDNPARADYDYQVNNTLVEIKWNPAAAHTANVAIEETILEDSKSFLFIIGWPIGERWYARVLTRWDIQSILQSQKLTFKGRFHRYMRIPTGQTFPDGTRKVSSIVPTKDLMGYGQGVDQWVEGMEIDKLMF